MGELVESERQYVNDLRTVVEVSDVHPAVITIVTEGVLGKLGKNDGATKPLSGIPSRGGD